MWEICFIPSVHPLQHMNAPYLLPLPLTASALFFPHAAAGPRSHLLSNRPPHGPMVRAGKEGQGGIARCLGLGGVKAPALHRAGYELSSHPCLYSDGLPCPLQCRLPQEACPAVPGRIVPPWPPVGINKTWLSHPLPSPPFPSRPPSGTATWPNHPLPSPALSPPPLPLQAQPPG